MTDLGQVANINEFVISKWSKHKYSKRYFDQNKTEDGKLILNLNGAFNEFWMPETVSSKNKSLITYAHGWVTTVNWCTSDICLNTCRELNRQT